MGFALETVAGIATAPGATLTGLTVAAGQSLTVRNTNPNVDIRLMALWANNNVAGVFRVRSPRLHDAVQGIRTQVQPAFPLPALPMKALQKLYPQDNLTVEISGSAVAGAIETGFVTIYYQDLPGVASRLITPQELDARAVNVLGVEVDITPGVGGNWTGASALNKTFDNLKANVDYAILGATFSAATGAVGITGPDTGNLIIGIPGLYQDPIAAMEWFHRLSRISGVPVIPVVNAANKAGTTIYAAATQAGTAVNVSLTLAELVPPGAPNPAARALA